jgi:hypothetical protein
MTLPLDLYYYDSAPDQPAVTIQVRSVDEPMVITTAAGKVHAWPGTAEHPDATLSGPPRLLIAALSGRLDLDDARRQGLRIEGTRPPSPGSGHHPSCSGFVAAACMLTWCSGRER